ncbi:MAG: NADH-quinone oxidoreductase subunit N [Alphaproteobacteria bacterium ADurb.Bin438]|nr:MAG: NADH-quinone oxidoreductase subunit N [Alphaproteobacteria bacterium ADurb.Bin438]
MILLSYEILIVLMIVALILEGSFLKIGNLLNISYQSIICLFILFVYLFLKGYYSQSLITLLSSICLILSSNWFKVKKFKRFEYPVILIISMLSMIKIVSSNNLSNILLSFVCFIISSSCLVIYKRKGERSTTAGIKYTSIMIISLIIFLGGISFLLQSDTSLNMKEIFVSNNYGNIGLVLIIISLLIPSLIIPFSLFANDVYEGSLTPSSGFLLSLSKVPMFITISKLYPHINNEMFIFLIKVLALITIIIPAISSLNQKSIKRFITTLSFVTSGMILLLITLLNEKATEIITPYLFIESITIIGCFGFILLLNNNGNFLENLDSIRGIGKKFPFISIIFSGLILSFGGFPMFKGFNLRYELMVNLFNKNDYILLFGVFLSILFSISSSLRVVRNLYLDYEIPKLEPFNKILIMIIFLSFISIISITPF